MRSLWRTRRTWRTVLLLKEGSLVGVSCSFSREDGGTDVCVGWSYSLLSSLRILLPSQHFLMPEKRLSSRRFLALCQRQIVFWPRRSKNEERTDSVKLQRTGSTRLHRSYPYVFLYTSFAKHSVVCTIALSNAVLTSGSAKFGRMAKPCVAPGWASWTMTGV